ncbi:MAG: redoxin domain-containing protein, partial [Alphaproteobacteria bacterium]
MTATSAKLTSGSAFPEIDLPLVGGGEVHLGGGGRWQVIVVYRGKHCPLCKRYLKTLEGLKAGFEEAGAEIVALSGDPKEKADADKAELG